MFGSLFSGCGSPAPKFVEGTPTGYLYSYSGMMAYPIEWYCVEKSEDGELHLLYSNGGPDISVYQAPSDLLERIGAMVREHKLYKLESSYHPPMQVMDGYMWHIAIEYEKDGIWSGGSNARPPKELSAGIAAINSYLKGFIDSGEPVGQDSHMNRRP